ncbi:MAG: diaminopimelate decarboxylase [Ignavibacteria bacterium]|nr:diaminopimelate decarboxylase [Ignavibacteria bacterium]
MKYLENRSFYYNNNKLYVESIPVEEIVAAFGTPLYIYSEEHLRHQVDSFNAAFKEISPRVFYAVKANNNVHIIQTMHALGCGADVNSAGELYKALKAGVPGNFIIFAGVGKTEEEIRYALQSEVLLIKAESEAEISTINTIAGELGCKARVALRVNPDVDAKTHPYISTGLLSNKFGLAFQPAYSLYTSHEFKNIHFTGIDMHLGSQILSADPYCEAAQKIVDFILTLRASGLNLHHLDMGGGFGITYRPEEKSFDLPAFAQSLSPLVKNLGMEIFFEPGRFFTGNAGILVTKVLYSKKNGMKEFLVVDAGMSELIRPALYSSYHHVQPVTIKEREERIFDVVGPICESSDYFAKERELPLMERGEYLAVCSGGAYGSVMSSQYNARPRVPEILVQNSTYTQIRRRDSLEDLLTGE